MTASKRRKISNRQPIVISISHELGKIPSLDSSCIRSARSKIVKHESPPPFHPFNLSSAFESNNNPSFSTPALNSFPSLSAHESASLSAPELAALSITASAFQAASSPATVSAYPSAPELAALSITASAFQPAPELASQSTLASALPSTSVSPSQSQAVVPDNYHHEHPYKRDELDHIIEQSADKLLACGSLTEFLQQEKDPRGNFHPNVGKLRHPAAHLLTRLKTSGAPVVTKNKPWNRSQKIAALERGPHKSAKEHLPFLREEYTDFCNKRFWTILPADLVLDELFLRLSPLGCVPQRDRRPRMISDYTYFRVNGDTLQLAPPEAMQFGRALKRVLQRIYKANPKFGPVYLSKIDISDGFYRIAVRTEDAPKLAVLFPTREGEPPLVGIPLVLPMGWCESPPSFCVATETTCDEAKDNIENTVRWESTKRPHRLDVISESQAQPSPAQQIFENQQLPADVPNGSFRDSTQQLPKHLMSVDVPNVPVRNPLKKPLRYWDVYVDDFIGATQGNKWRRRRVKRALFTALDSVFRPVDELDSNCRQEPASVKKLLKGDGRWDTRKIILGWLIDTIQGTIELPPHRIERLNTLLDSIAPDQRVIAVKQWHQVLGELRSMSIAIPGSRGLFSVLQEALRHMEKDRPRIRITRQVQDFLEDFRYLAKDIASRPTRIAELVPADIPDTIGACDAAGTGMGGVHFFVNDKGEMVPLLWRKPFSASIRRRLVSFNNPTGDITNSDLEAVAYVAHNDVLVSAADVREKTIHNFSDNIPTVYWNRKGSTTTTGPAAYILRLASLHQRVHRYVPKLDYIPGVLNVMADTASRAWHLTDPELLAHFNSNFPQTRPWRICFLKNEMNSNLISALSKKRSDPASLRPTPTRRMLIGTSGLSSVLDSNWTHSSVKWPIQSPSSKFLHNDIEMEGLPPAVNPSDLGRLRTPSVQWDRCTPAWGPLTPGPIGSPVKSTFESDANSVPTRKPTQRLHESNLSL